MRIVCPSCAAAYDVPDERLSAGRSVRCSGCEARWVPLEQELLAEVQTQTPTQVPPAQLPEPVPELVRKLPVLAEAGVVPAATRTAPPVVGSPSLVMAGWVLTVLVLGGAGWAGYARRDAVMHVWPPSERVYAALGLRP